MQLWKMGKKIMTEMGFRLYMMSFGRPWVCMVPAWAMRVLSMRLMESMRAGKGRLVWVSG